MAATTTDVVSNVKMEIAAKIAASQRLLAQIAAAHTAKPASTISTDISRFRPVAGWMPSFDEQPFI